MDVVENNHRPKSDRIRYRYVRAIAGRGAGPDKFTEALRGVAVDPAGFVYAVGDTEVKVFEPAGALRRRWRTGLPGYCVAIDAEGTVHVGQSGQVEKFSRAGELLSTWRAKEPVGLVTAIGFYGEYVLLADATNRCIHRYDKNGKLINSIGKDNNTDGFVIPNGTLDFCVDDRGIVHVSHAGKLRVERYTLEGELLGQFGKFGMRDPADFRGCCNPTNLALTRDGHVVVTEKAAPRIKVYDAQGGLLAVVGEEAFDSACKNMDVAVDARGFIYVVDTVRLRICVFGPEDRETVTRPASAPA